MQASGVIFPKDDEKQAENMETAHETPIERLLGETGPCDGAEM